MDIEQTDITYYGNLCYHLTSGACPEQYDVYKGKHLIGYVRLRHDILRCYYRYNRRFQDKETVYKTTYGGGDTGDFHTQKDREKYLTLCNQKLLERYKQETK